MRDMVASLDALQGAQLQLYALCPGLGRGHADARNLAEPVDKVGYLSVLDSHVVQAHRAVLQQGGDLVPYRRD